MSSRLLLVDDDPIDGFEAVRRLSAAGYQVDWLKSGWVAQRELQATTHLDAILLALQLPGLDGIAAVREIRQRGDATPVMFVSNFPSVQSRIDALNAGADDLLAKPYDSAELLARVLALLRRSEGTILSPAGYGSLTLNPTLRCVYQHGLTITLSRSEYLVLERLMQTAGESVTRSELELALTEKLAGVSGKTIEVLIHRLRGKLGMTSINTIRGVGYRLSTT